MIPKKLKQGDHIRIIASSEGFMPKFTNEMRKNLVKRLESLGLQVSFGKYVDELNDFDSASIEHRLEDLHAAFEDPDVQAILSANGGSSANQLLPEIDYELIKNNPKIFCGLSDLTEINCAIYTEAGLVTYYGPHASMLGASQLSEHALKNMKETFFSTDPVELKPSEYYLNDQWEKDLILNSPYWTINEGEAEGRCVGGNLMTFNFLLGGLFMPGIEGNLLYLEENHLIDYKGFQKELQEVLNNPESQKISGLLIGRFQRETGMTRELLTEIVKSKKQLQDIPVIGNVDFSHTAPMISMPYGGKLQIKAAANDEVKILVTEH